MKNKINHMPLPSIILEVIMLIISKFTIFEY